MKRIVPFLASVAALLVLSLYLIPLSAQQPPVMTFGADGATGAVQRMTSLANYIVSTTLTSRPTLGANLSEKGTRWTVVSAPSAGSQGSASIAAEAATRHIVDCVSYSGESSGGAVTAAAGTFVVRDGASGAGTIIWAFAVAHQVAAGAGIQTISPQTVCGLGLVGTTNIAMTAELDAGITNELQRVSLSGYNVQ